MTRGIIYFLQVLLIAGGLVLIGYGIYSYFGPDLAYAVQQVAPGGSDLNITPGAVRGQAQVGALTFPYPKGKGQPGEQIIIPHMKLNTAIKEASWSTSNQKGNLYTDWNLPYDAAGHLQGTAQPGEAGNMVISGHNNLVGPNQFGVGLFAGLWDLKPGDYVYVINQAGVAFQYRVTDSYPLKEESEPASVRAQHAEQVLKDTGKPMATLITCWNGAVAPLSGNTYRWIVKGDLVGPVDPNSILGGTTTP